jgi:fermentation-respiration switch protein FrsA (DUF1100 family)
MFNKTVWSFLFVFLSVVLHAQEDERLFKKAEKITWFLQNNFPDSVSLQFNEQVSKQLPPVTFKMVWAQIQNQAGQLQKCGPVVKSTDAEHTVYSSQMDFALMPLELRLSFDDKELIKGIFFAPAKKESVYKPAAYINEELIGEKKLVIKGTNYELPARLHYPKKISKAPCIVLVHGSGPHDMDETIDNNKPFMDLSKGLATMGYAVLTYDKRTFVVKGNPEAGATIYSEVVEDAVLAIQLASEQQEVDKDKIILAGHSLGGFLAPEIARLSGKTKGIVLLAAPARPLEEIIYQQYEFILGLDSLDDTEERKLKDLKKQVDLIKNRKYDLSTPASELPLQLPALYWQSIQNYDALKTVSKLNQKILLLRGDKDYQVTSEDTKKWLSVLPVQQIKSIEYPGLFHLFMEGSGLPSDYQTTANVNYQVLSDIDSWIKANF